MESSTGWDKALRVSVLVTSAAVLYATRSWVWGAAWLAWRSVCVVWGHLLWDPTWLGSIINFGIVLCAYTAARLSQLPWLQHVCVGRKPANWC